MTAAQGRWTYLQIGTAVRNYCSMPSTSQLSAANMLAQINRYFRWVLPSEVRPMQLQTWYAVTLTAGDADYDLKETFYETYAVLGSTAYISATSGYKQYNVDVYFEPSTFYELWVDDKDYTASANRGLPSDVLVYNNELLFRKCPSTTYYFNIEVWRRPYVYASGGSTTQSYFGDSNGDPNNSDQPEVEEWGNIIALGASKQILLEAGDDESVQRVEGLYQRELSKINSQTLLWLSPRRPAPKF